jgi:hypothetical protein
MFDIFNEGIHRQRHNYILQCSANGEKVRYSPNMDKYEVFDKYE